MVRLAQSESIELVDGHFFWVEAMGYEVEHHTVAGADQGFLGRWAWEG